VRGCDLLKLKVSEISQGGRINSRATILQKKTQRPVQFEITEQTRDSVLKLITESKIRYDQYLFQSRNKTSEHLSTRQYARIVCKWVTSIGLDPAAYGTHSMRRTKATLIYKRTKNLRAVQLLLGHTKLESTVRYLGIEVEDALEISELTEF
jgi:integrase